MGKRLAFLGAVLLLTAGRFWVRRRPPDPPRRSPPAPAEPVAVQIPIPAVAKETPPPAVTPVPKSRARSAMDRLLAALRSGDREKVEEALEELRVELIPPPVPDAENAALLYKKAFELYVGGLDDEETDAMCRLSEGHAITVEDRAKLQAVLDRNREALKLLHEAAGRPRCNFGVDYSQGAAAEIPHVNGMIRSLRLLEVEAFMGEGAGVTETARAAHRLSEATAGEPTLISQLVRGICLHMSGEVLQHEFDGAMTRDRLDSLVAGLSPDAIRSGFEKTLLFELYSGVKYVTEGGTFNLLYGGVPTPRRPEDPLTAQDLTYFAETMSEYAALADRPYHEVREEIARIEAARVDGAPWYAEVTRLMLPAMGKAQRRLAMTEASVGTARLAAALRLYREENGRYPDSIDAVRGLLPVVPADPFTGKPYLYRREGSGFLVYSVGEDGFDGGGQGGETGEADVVFRSKR